MELLVVIAIIGILVGLLLPAVQSAREAARRAQCQNNLKQMGIAATTHNSQLKHFPSGGWGWFWIGDPDRGAHSQQPGGWIFNLLPFVEQANVYNLQSGKTGAARTAAAKQMLETPIALFNCPSRRVAKLTRCGAWDGRQQRPCFTDPTPLVAMADYAGNGGDAYTDCGTAGAPLNYYGPNTIADAESDAGKQRFLDLFRISNGVIFPGSMVQLGHIRDGASNTFLFGEKYVNPEDYDAPENGGDNESMYIGDNGDNVRWCGPNYAPRRDRPGDYTWSVFGSAHADMYFVVFCDGSVRGISYSIDLETHRRLGSRRDNLPIDASKL